MVEAIWDNFGDFSTCFRSDFCLSKLENPIPFPSHEMAQNILSANWKKLQATLKSAQANSLSSQPSPKNGVKRKRVQAPATQDPSVGDPQKSRKKQRTRRAMDQALASAKSSSLRDIEDSQDVSRPRPSKRDAAENVNAGLSSESVVWLSVSHCS